MADFKEFKEIDLANKKEVGSRNINIEHIVEIEIIAKTKYDNKVIYQIKLSNGDSFHTITPYQ